MHHLSELKLHRHWQPKAPLKQRTLLDSFVTRISSKAVPLESSLQLGESSITTIDTCKDMTEDIGE